MKQQIIDRFPGIGCAWADAMGKETTEYYGFADRENQVFVDEKNYISGMLCLQIHHCNVNNEAA